ncbi:anti-sigma factor [Arthrobacter jiangjiafuii]|uniref:Regulator of SigK n=1 Tax=Arthrobacter jiangjiafuii TaxID=2817475 RepID=A0A975QZ08_9MICC|nr:anti-sigma factor [Arthrobacter jiangjiafuii]MBP3044578.1 anti-sigma factor [Arthrobacter jiangjiafuii]QWC09320.1 anti-sigma factor [Arthrobacter jiangjiafuii]
MPENSAEDTLNQDLANGRLLEWAEVYALDALPREEQQAVDNALEQADPALRQAFLQRVWRTREALAGGYRAEAAPPADLFERIVARLPGREAGTGGTPQPTTAAPSAQPGDELAARRSRRSPLGAAGRWILAGAAAAAIVVGGVSIASNLDPDSVSEEVLQASDLQQRVIELPTGGTAEVALSKGEDAAVVTLSGVPAPPEGSVYQMWRVPADGSAPVSVGTMTGEDVSGSKATELTGIDPYSAVAVTVEPDGGSVTPTLPVVLEIPFSA